MPGFPEAHAIQVPPELLSPSGSRPPTGSLPACIWNAAKADTERGHERMNLPNAQYLRKFGSVPFRLRSAYVPFRLSWVQDRLGLLLRNQRRRNVGAGAAATQPWHTTRLATTTPASFQFLTKTQRSDVSRELGGKFVHNCNLHEV